MRASNELPSSWVCVPLGELGDWYGGGTPSKANEKFWSNGKIPWFSPKDMKAFRLRSSEDQITRAAVNSSSVDVFPPDTVLMVVRSGILAHTFPVAVAGIEATMNQDLKGVVPKDGVDATYLAYALRSSGRDILNQCSKAGTTVASIDTLALHRYSIPLAPTSEQQRVVEKLDELLSDLDTGIVALERARANLKRYRSAVLKAAVEGRLTEKWRTAHPDTKPATKLLERVLSERRKKWGEAQIKRYAEKGQLLPKGWKDRYPEPLKADIAALPALPDGWCWASVDQLSTEVRNGTAKKPSKTGAGYRVLRINAVRPLAVDLEEIRYLDIDRAEATDSLIQNDDLLFTRYNGSPELVGVVGLVRGCQQDTLHPDKLIRVRIVDRGAIQAFLEIACNVGSSREYIRGKTRTTAGQAGVSGLDIKQTPVPLPPRNEQARIVEEISRSLGLIGEAETEVRNGLLRSVRLRQAILKRAFEGKLVPQDPKDEPASELLARIRAARGRENAKLRRGRGAGGRFEIVQICTVGV